MCILSLSPNNNVYGMEMSSTHHHNNHGDDLTRGSATTTTVDNLNDDLEVMQTAAAAAAAATTTTTTANVDKNQNQTTNVVNNNNNNNMKVQEMEIQANGNYDYDNQIQQSQQQNVVSNAEEEQQRLLQLKLGIDIGVEQVIDINNSDAIFNKIHEAQQYINNVVMEQKIYTPIRTQCKNAHSHCAFWSIMGECTNNPSYMKLYCAPICQSCNQLLSFTLPDDNMTTEQYYAIHDVTGSDIGEAQVVDNSDIENTNAVIAKIIEARKYMYNVVMMDDIYEPIRYTTCTNMHEKCAYWATLGECNNNPTYMLHNCAPVCQSCDQLQVETRCKLDPNAIDAWYPGDLDKMFTKITTDPYYVEQYQPQIISKPKQQHQPTLDNNNNNNNADHTDATTTATDDNNNDNEEDGPWLVVLENVVTKDEAARLIELGGIEGYARSADVGERLEDGTYGANINEGRTSENAWCIDQCYNDPVAQTVMERLSNITGIPEINSENLQLLRYEKGQFYQPHNDYVPYQVNRQCGVRILTVYLYLNNIEDTIVDNDEEDTTNIEYGGKTGFPLLNVEVTPKVGRAVLWPSVLNDQPNIRDDRTEHTALPVLRGIKYGANAWFHQRDFKTANNNGCA